jgi:signal transduction histidine kinase
MIVGAREMTILVQGLAYLIYTISTARHFLREPGQVRLHTLLIFGSATSMIILAEIGVRLYETGTREAALFLLRLSAICALFVLFALFLLAGELTNLRRWLGWLSIGILILGGGFILMMVSRFPNTIFFVAGVPAPPLALAIFPLLLGSFLLIAMRFWYCSILASGAIRRRLQWFGASCVLACLSAVVAMACFFTPDYQFMLSLLECLLLLLTGSALYLSCVPPRWLRRSWLLPELEHASRFNSELLTSDAEVPSGEAGQVPTAAIDKILQHAMNGFGALVGTVQLWNEERGALETVSSIFPPEARFAAEAKAMEDEAFAEVFGSGQPMLKRISRRLCPVLRRPLGSGLIMLAPLKRRGHTLGVIGVCCAHAPNFNTGDLPQLQLFADQITCLLTRQLYEQHLAAIKAMRHEQALKDEFIALTAHDLRTPLTILKGRLQLLRRQLLKEGQPDAAEAVAKLDAPYNRLSQLITTLLDISYLDTGRLHLLLHSVDLIGLVRKVVEASSERKIVLEVEEVAPQGQTTPMIVSADAGRLEQVLENLLDNAHKYSPVESKITVRVERCAGGNEALLSVRDLGIGIPVEEQPHLFERWFRATNNPAQTRAGPGLGLYISHEIATLHGGRLWAESSGISGEGSTFFLTLPLIDPQHVSEAGSRAKNRLSDR